ncbi:MAG: Fe-S cluster assembly protein SufD [Bacteroidales bacterium]|nr:Fe-S cluster assembly protein SufD [Bacteroidales bacterium]
MGQQDNICECFACDIPSLDTIKIKRRNGEFIKENGAVFNCLQQQMEVTSLGGNHCVIKIRDNAEILRPIQIINLLDGEKNENISSEVTIVAGENSKVTFLYCDDTLPKTEVSLTNTINVKLNSYSAVEFYKMENVNNATRVSSSLVFDSESQSNLKTFFITLNGGHLKNNICVNFNGEHALADLNGLYLMDRQQSVETQMRVNHYKNSCRSIQLFKGILDDEAKADFLGHILVDYNAQGNDARQTNNNILLTDKAKVNTRPVLEIYNDDVQCSHGATTGQLDEQALYYLQSRGISKKQAKMLLMNAFCQSVIAKSGIEELKNGLSELIQKRLDGGLSMENPFKIQL